jgi:replication-associated recombination protein RarA
MVIFASEDIGLAEPAALVGQCSLSRVETIGYPEAGINLAHGVIYLSAGAEVESGLLRLPRGDGRCPHAREPADPNEH